jgi:3-methyladenine DNA glycosylase/8-oxoguanine DNA glycosylase
MSEELYFSYGDKEVNWLKSKDKVLAEAIDQIGHINRPINPNLFFSLVDCIVGQQISAKAHATIRKRMQEKFGEELTPVSLVQASIDDIQTCGMSIRKAEYIQTVANDVYGGKLDLAELVNMSDDEIKKRLVEIKGIGTWTAEMLMIFSLQRPDILSYDDLAIIRGMRMLYHHRKITPQLFKKYFRRYTPYATVASIYLWEISTGRWGHVDLASKK